MRILVISQYYYPEQFRINDICKELVKKGHKVTVLTGIPNYPEGKFYKGYGLTKRRKDIKDGVDIIRLPIIPRSKNSITLILNYISFVISGFFWSKFTNKNFDKVFIYEVSPMLQALPGVWYAKRKKIDSYIYVMDLWPESIQLVTNFNNKTILKLINKVVDYIYKNCKKIFTSSESFIENIHKRGHSRNKLVFWPQYAEEFYKPLNRGSCRINEMNTDDFKIIFAGNIGYAQGLDIVIDTARILKERNIKVKFYLIGNGRAKEELIKNVEENNLQDYIKFIDKQPAEKIPEYYANADMAFITLKKNLISDEILPAKLQSYFACGVPILGSADGEIKQVIEKSKAGFCVESGNSEKLAEQIEKSIKLTTKELEQMKQNSIKYYEKNYKKQMLLDKLEKEMEIRKDDKNV